MPGTDDAGAAFDAWYAAMATSPQKDAIVQQHLGLPPSLLSTSTLSLDGLEVVGGVLALRAGELLVDLACGRGGYGLELASRSGCRLVGIDIAPSAVEAAHQLAARRGVVAEFRVGDLAATGLPDAEADAVLVVDAIQFASSPPEAYQEIRRILRPGGRAALTCWEPVDRTDGALPDILRRVDLRDGLERAGFVDVMVSERPDWRQAEEALWRAAAELDPGADQALIDFHEEGLRALPALTRVKRVLASGRTPE